MRIHWTWFLGILLISCSGEDGALGPQGEPGENGYHCWDLNLNGINDQSEDVNEDGTWNGLDCLGQDGLNGANGINCWDLDGDWFNDEDEDINSDGQWNALDCQGKDGENGEDGNANVQKIVLDFDDAYYNENTALFLAPELYLEVMQTHVLIFTLENVQNVNYSTFLAVPGGLSEIDRKYDVLLFSDGGVHIIVSNFDGTNSNPGWTGTWEFLHVTLIKISALNDKNGLPAIKASLKKSGIDVHDFDALAPYFDDE
ncbi:hypothetical protein [Flagellimonas flava]|uniref:Uncharacterized protein n=1 Tax=Flagellimonas flava TaxID=570519 RepID=A0A1M5I7L8_9FLAO|nr:hypothetical protein [Allomuricauda flava]SHG24261.1 hypothetical protein SAMN04488116_0499 [Allomuricauda flava]